MNTFLTAMLRSMLQIGGTAIGVGSLVTDDGKPNPTAAASLVIAAAGAAWAQYRALKTKRLQAAVNASPALPSAKDVERATPTVGG